jgi:glutamyl-tRNA synthetase
MTFDNAVIEDFVLLRSDATPTYQLSVVSDDIAMRITHVVRGDDHISNTPKQILLYRALGADVPAFGHLPLILGEDKKRLSKRHGATSVLDYRDAGYLPEAMFNFLALLGWSPGDDRQKMSTGEMIDAFSFDGVGRSGAVFDLQKLEWLNGQYIAAFPIAQLVTLVKPHLEAAGLWREEFDGAGREWLRQVLALVQPRCKTVVEFIEAARPLLDPSDELVYEADAAAKHLKGADVAGHLAALRDTLARTESWEKTALEAAVRGLAESRGISAGKLIHPARLAVTGRGASPGIFEVLELLGRERSLARIDRLLRHLATR